MMGKNNAKLTPLELYYQAGINPKTGLPNKFTSPKTIEVDILKQLRILDEQTAVNRGRWYNLPCDLSSQELERMLYYKGQLAFFYLKELEKFYFMPYALQGGIDFYGRYKAIHPVPFASGTDDKNQSEGTTQAKWLSTKVFKCIYDVVTEEKDITEEMLTGSCVLLHDYTKQLSQTCIPRKELQEPLLGVMSEIIPMMRTGLLANSGIKGMRVQDQDQADAVIEANAGIETAAKTGQPWVPIVGTIDFQELTNGNAGTKSQDYMLTLQSLDNYRLSLYGIDNGGLFEKKAHELQEEAAINGANVGLVLQDAVSIRQRFCNIVNSIWGLGIWYEPSEDITQVDVNGDGIPYDEDNDVGGRDYESSSNEE